MNELQMSTARDTSSIVASQIMEGTSMEGRVITTRFGDVTITVDNPITIGKGMLGFPDQSRFCLVNFPVQKFQQFKLLQSLEDEALSFITLPLDVDNQIISRPDIEEVCNELSLPINDLAILLIVSVHRDQDLVRLSVNARAPIFVNTPERSAEQCVMRNNSYMVRHFISAPKSGN